jgi:hypothetical protein
MIACRIAIFADATGRPTNGLKAFGFKIASGVACALLNTVKCLSSANIQSGVTTPFFESIVVVWSILSCNFKLGYKALRCRWA